MSVVIESGAPDVSTAIALDSLGLEPAAPWNGFTPLPTSLLQGIVALSGAITGIVWLLGLRGR